MTDIVERLRDTVQILATTQMNLSMEAWDRVSNAVLEAAETITALRAENEKLRAALSKISEYEIKEGCPCNACKHSAIARAALEEKQ